MSKDATRPVLSVIVRRFMPDIEPDIREAFARLQRAAEDQPGYIGAQNSLSQRTEWCELVTVFAFDSRRNLDRWERSNRRKSLLAALDRHPQESSKHAGFDRLALLPHPASRIGKAETVAILIVWILSLGTVLGGIADHALPDTVPRLGRDAIVVSINVLLISYIFLPWSSVLLTRLKDRLSPRR